MSGLEISSLRFSLAGPNRNSTDSSGAPSGLMDMMSAPIPSTGVPNHGIESATKSGEKDMLATVNATPEEMTVTPAAGYNSADGDVEPTEEEFATLRK